MSHTIIDALKEAVSSQGVIEELDTKETISYKDLDEYTTAHSGFFKEAKGKPIVVVLPNSINYLKAFFSAQKAGAIFSPLPYFVSDGEVSKILEYIQPELVLTDRQDIIEKYGQFHTVKSYDEFDSFSGEALKHTPHEDDLACLYYSSGTTGNPKGVLYSHKNIDCLIKSIVKDFGFDQNTKQMAFLPFGHTASINYNIFPAIYCGSSLLISKGFEFLRTSFFEVLAAHKVNYTEIVPTVAYMLLKLGLKTDHLDLSHTKFVGCGSSTLPLETQKRFQEVFGLPLANLYGLSETGPSHFDNPMESGWEPGSIGRPLGVNECKISSDGEILLKGDNIFRGYFKNESLYSEVVKDGWFHTGDLGYEKDGKFFFEDRKKDLIIKGGVNIVPSEIEEIIYKSPEITECVVVGVPDNLYGEAIWAVVVPKSLEDEKKTISGVKEICKKHLSNYKVPSVVKIVEEIPKTHSGKLLRKKVRETIRNS